MLLELLLAFKFLKGSSIEKNISSMVKVCFISISLSTFALALVASIMNGFEKATHKKLQGIHSDIIITSQGTPLNFEKIEQVIKSNYSDLISVASPSSSSQVIIENKTNNKIIRSLVVINAIDPEKETKVSSLKKMIIKPINQSNNWQELLKENGIFIGQSLAENLEINLNDSITLLYPDEDSMGKKITLLSQQAKVCAIFKTGIHEFDQHIIISSLDFFSQIFQPDIIQINIKLKDKTKERQVIETFKDKFNVEAYSWKNLYPALVSALKLEKLAMFIILTLVTAIAAMNIISLLFMLITQKRREIALFKSLGMANRSIIYIFILISFIISLTASSIGIILAWIISKIIDNYSLIKLPDVYYVAYLPSDLSVKLSLLILAIVLFLSLIISIIPTSKIKNLNIVDVLKAIVD